MTPAPLRLRRDPGGLYDLEGHRMIELGRLADHVGDGGRFVAVTHDTGEDCTRRVLAELLAHIAARRATGGVTDALTGLGGGQAGGLVGGLAGLLAGATAAGDGSGTRRAPRRSRPLDDDAPER